LPHPTAPSAFTRMKVRPLITLLVPSNEARVVYERRAPPSHPVNPERPVLKFKHTVKIDLKSIAGKVKPGMEIVDQAKMTNALRQQSKIEYLDFSKQMRQKEEMKKKLNSKAPSVPPHTVGRRAQKERRTAAVPDWKLDLGKVRSSIPRSAVYRRAGRVRAVQPRLQFKSEKFENEIVFENCEQLWVDLPKDELN
jgi:hypothetical protein